MKYNILIIVQSALLVVLSTASHAGPFAPAAGTAGSTAIDANASEVIGWASAVNAYQPGTDVDIGFQTPERSLGPAGNSDGNNNGVTFDIVSLGRGGSITHTFDSPISNGAGADFAIFENSFSDNFLELAWVEVSSNGNDFIRFAGASLTSTTVGPFSNTMDPSNITGLAGKYRAGFGTPFDLELLLGSANLDVNNISHVRIVDIVGDGSVLDDLSVSVGPNPIYDPFPTTGSAGFDLESVAVMHFANAAVEENVPIPSTALFVLGLILFALKHLTVHSAELQSKRRSQNH